MTILVTNTNDHVVILHSHCGNSVPVGAKARDAQVAKRFGWQVPEGVIVRPGPEAIVDPCAHVRGRAVRPLANPPRTMKEAAALEARGLAPHQTPQSRAARAEFAKRLLADMDEKRRGESASSSETLRRAGATNDDARGAARRSATTLGNDPAPAGDHEASEE